MATRDTLLMIRNLKGAPATILLMMLGLGRPTGRDELVLLTTYSEHTVQKALDQLAYLGLARNHGRHKAWALTAHVAQSLPVALPAGEEQNLQTDPDAGEPNPTREVQKPHLESLDPARDVQIVHLDPDAGDPGPVREVQKPHLESLDTAREVQKMHLGSSSSYYTPSSERHQSLQTSETTTTRDREKCTSPPPVPGAPVSLDPCVFDADAEAAVDLLRPTGCPEVHPAGRGIRGAIRAALAGGWTGADVLDATRGWLAYAATPAGKSIDHAGFLALARIRACRWPPEPPPKSAADITRAYIDAAYDRIVRR